MKLAHCATILIGTLSIGGGLAQAQDPWDPQGQGTHLQRVFVPGLSDYDSFYIQSTLNKPISAPNGVLSVAPGPTLFQAVAIDKNGAHAVNVKVFNNPTHRTSTVTSK